MLHHDGADLTPEMHAECPGRGVLFRSWDLLAPVHYLVATWIVAVWQNRELGEYAPAWDPGTRHSPNTLFAAAMSQGGFALQIPAPELYYELLPVHLVKIHGRRGVKIRGLWYDGPALDPYRSVPSPQGGAARGKWKIRREPRDRRHVYFCDPHTHDWHPLRWTGLPPEGEVPSFSDLRADDLLHAARAVGLQPRSDAELLPLLLDLIGGLIPVDAWPTQMSRQQRTAHARETAQAEQAAADRPAPAGRAAAAARQDDENAGADAAVVPMRWRDQARDAAAAVDAERRRRRRERAAGSRPEPAPLMRDALRRSSMLRLPEDDSGRPRAQSAVPGRSGCEARARGRSRRSCPFRPCRAAAGAGDAGRVAAVAGHPELVRPGPAAGPGRMAGTVTAAADAL